ncbi:L-tyrosine 3-hydroxylase [Actinokineospora enzanensis]|uniref:L-tyrosine 3-hydroxylase n=1 Tax=Actinokineospora enzanensis TaxID=155975 RepID=UPI001B7FBF22|nr:L-tyrosine 3-hydroxylase [Actinokineospora enzanensis]
MSAEPGCRPVLQARLLFLPPTGAPFESSTDHTDDHTTGERTCQEYDVFGTTPVDPQPLFWYRWIAGHQISFMLWRAMHDVVWHHPDDVPSERELDMLAACVDSYSAMLLYSSTVPRDHYHTNIRVLMALQHPSFSGAWAPDYRPIRRLFRGKVPWLDAPACRALGEAVARNGTTHSHIADHLVPDGRSLLQQSAGAPGVSVSREKEDLYDNFFLTVRRPVSQAELVAQLDSRIVELAADLRHNGLYPEVDGHHHPVVTAWSGTPMRPLVDGVVRTLSRATRLVSEMRLEEARS